MSAGTTTFLFTDLVGSTELTSRLGDEAAHELRRVHFRLLRDAVAATGGEEIKSLGDGLMVAFRSATDAVSCAVAMQQATHRHNERSSGERLGLRIGVNVGDAIRAEKDYFGTPVIAAKRLCDRASSGQILASGLVYGLVGSRAGHGFRDVGELSLKGLRDPVGTYEVVWEPVAPGRMPLPPIFAGRQASSFVGRRDALQALSAEFERACAGDCRLVLIAGEPGIGKTRLVAEFCAVVHERGARIMLGRCTEETLVPYEPFVEAISRYVSDCPLDELRLDLGDLGGELRRLVPKLAERLPGLPEPLRSDPAGERHRLFGAVAGLLSNVAAPRPLVVVVDDLHWADKATVLLLAHAVRTARASPLLILGTYRETELRPTDPLAATLADLRRDQLFERVSLAGLDEHKVADLVGGIVGQATPPQFARAIQVQTDGNPFFIEEVVRHLRETGAVPEHGGGWTRYPTVAQQGIPAGVKEVIGQRLAGLGTEAIRVLALASVVGRDFDLDLLDAIGVAAGGPALEILEHAVGVGLIAEVPDTLGRYSFSHALIRETLYDDLTRTRRVHLHREIAVALERRCKDDPGPRLGELAYHFLQAAPGGDLDKAVDYATRAAERAITQVAYEEAAAHYAAAVGALEAQGEGASPRSAELLLGLGDAQRLAGDPEAARGTFRHAAGVARSHGSHDQLGRAARRLTAWTHAYALRAQPDEIGARLLEEALDALGDEESALRATLLAQLAFARYFDRGPLGERSTRFVSKTAGPAREALEVARRVGEPTALGDALHAQMYAVAGLDPHAALSIAAEMLELGERGGDWELVLWARSWRVLHVLMLGDIAAVAAETEAFGDLADDLKVPVYQWFSARWRFLRAFLEGRFDDAERLALEAFQVGQDAQQEQAAALHLGGQLASVRGMQGRNEELVGAIEAAVEQHAALPAWRCGLAAVYADLDREADARAQFEQLAVDDFNWLPRDWDWLLAVHGLVLACAYLRDAPRAAILYGQLEPFADYWACSGWATICSGPVSACLGVLATVMERWIDAERHFEAALQHSAMLGAPAFLAQTQHDYALMLLRHGEHVRALELAGQALGAAEKMGMSRLVQRARDLKCQAEVVPSG